METYLFSQEYYIFLVGFALLLGDPDCEIVPFKLHFDSGVVDNLHKLALLQCLSWGMGYCYYFHVMFGDGCHLVFSGNGFDGQFESMVQRVKKVDVSA